MRPSIARAVAWAVAAASFAATPASARPTPGQEPGRNEGRRDEIRRAESWPKLGAAELEKVKLDVERLRKARTPEMGEAARDALVAVGAGVAPALIAGLGREEEAAARERIVDVLDRIAAEEHTRLLAVEFAAKSPTVRKWALRRAAEFLDPGNRTAAEKALEHARKGLERKQTDKEELLRAAIACAAAGSLTGFDVLASNAYEAWGKYGAAAHRALAGVRGSEATRLAASALKPEDAPRPNDPALPATDRARIVAALRLLGGCGDGEAPQIVKPFLDSNDATVRIAAINAVRALLDGEPPLVDLAVFEAVETAKKLKARL